MSRSDYSDVARDFLKLAGIAPAVPDLDYLKRLVRTFSKLPYENLTKIVRAGEIEDPVARLRMPDIVLAEHLDLGAGGTCFSLVHFFRMVLAFIGYRVVPVMCDRSYGPNTHCALIVALGQERYLVDPGYLMGEPLLIPSTGDAVQMDGSTSIRLRRLGPSSQLLLITEGKGRSRIRYRLRDEAVSDDLFMRLWVDSFDWAMMRSVCVSRRVDEGQIFMRDGTIRLVGGTRKRRERLGAGFAAEVEKVFGIDSRIADLACDAVKGYARDKRFQGRS